MGLLPEEYFMYYEDVDFCVMVKNNGYKIIYNSKSKIYHKVSASSGEEESPFAIEWNTRNRMKFYKKYKDLGSNKIKGVFPIFFYTTRLLKCTKYLKEKRIDKIKSLRRGIIG